MYDELVEKVNATQTIDTCNIANKADHNTKIKDTENKIPNGHKYVTTTEFNNLTEKKIMKDRNKQI